MLQTCSVHLLKAPTCVLPGVGDQRRGHGEGHAAQVALVRFLPGVAPLVVRQGAGLSERLATDVADVRLLSAVESERNPQNLMSIKLQR